MNIDNYCLSDLPKKQIDQTNITQFTKQISLNNDFVKTINRKQILTTKFECLFILCFLSKENIYFIFLF